jgi:hypothetical protein
MEAIELLPREQGRCREGDEREFRAHANLLMLMSLE